MIIVFTIILNILLTLSALSILYSTLTCGISPMPSSRKVQTEILRLLKKYKSGNLVYELGSGWGNLVFTILKTDRECQVTGFERSPVPFLFSRFIGLIMHDKRGRIQYKDFFSVSLKNADIVVCYLCTDLMTKLKDKLDLELKKGAVVISSTFAVPGWKPVETVTVNDWYRSKIYVYRKQIFVQ